MSRHSDCIYTGRQFGKVETAGEKDTAELNHRVQEKGMLN